jgi:hypothetical protein
MGLKITIRRDKEHVELFYGEVYLGKIEISPHNKHTAAEIALSMNKEIKITFFFGQWQL